MDGIITEIDKALRKKGLSDAAASKLAVGHPSLIKNFRAPKTGEKRYNLTALAKLANVLDLELYFGPKREPPVPLPREIADLLGLPEGASVAAAVKVIERIVNAGESDGAVLCDDMAALVAKVDSLRDDMTAFLETRAKPPRNKTLNPRK